MCFGQRGIESQRATSRRISSRVCEARIMAPVHGAGAIAESQSRPRGRVIRLQVSSLLEIALGLLESVGEEEKAAAQVSIVRIGVPIACRDGDGRRFAQVAGNLLRSLIGQQGGIIVAAVVAFGPEMRVSVRANELQR